MLLTLNWSKTPSDIKYHYETLEAIIRLKVSHILNSKHQTWKHMMCLWLTDAKMLEHIAYVEQCKTVHSDPDVRKKSSEYNTKLLDLWNDVYSNRKLYTVWNKYITETKEVLSEPAKHLIVMVRQKFEKNGMSLSDSHCNQARSLLKKLNELSTDYSTNAKAYNPELHFTIDELQCLPEHLLTTLEVKDNKCVVPFSKFDSVLQHVISPQVRKQVFQYYYAKTIPENTKIMHAMFDCKQQIAKLFEKKSYSHYIMNCNTTTPEVASSFQYDIVEQLKPAYKKEKEELLKIKKELKLDGDLELWDISFLSNKYVNSKLNYDMDNLKYWFPVDKVVSGTITVYSKLLSIYFVETKASAWHENVKFYEVYDAKSKTLIGAIYMDLYERKDKSTNASSDTIVKRTSKYVPITRLFCSFTSSLLQFGDVKDLFHELGHCLHEICSESSFPLQSVLYDVPIDFVECPSQMFEHWCTEKQVLQYISHYTKDDGKYELGSSLSESLIEKIIASDKLCQLHSLMRQMALGIMDLEVHMLNTSVDTQSVFADTFKKITGYDVISETNYFDNWWHMYNDYDSMYYSYIWSQAFSVDMFYSKFKDDCLNTKTGLEFREKIFAPSHESPLELMNNFLGRYPDSKAFLKYIDQLRC